MKNIYVLATGGTIAGKASSETATTGYQAGAIGVDELLRAVPELSAVANLKGETIAAIDSKDMTEAIQLHLVHRVQQLAEDSHVDGIVITHGTDTLEETAYLLSLLVKSEKPIVLTGSMRPATALSADGPLNLLDSVRVAASPEAWTMGVLVVLNNQIDGAHDVMKTNATAVQTFQSPNGGSLGIVSDGKVEFFRRPLRLQTVPIPAEDVVELPEVRILYGYAGDDGAMVDAAVELGAKGIVYAGMGNGSVPAKVEQKLKEAVQKGIAVVRSSRSFAGSVVAAEKSYAEAGFIEGDTLSPQKARILLQLALLAGLDKKQMQQWFWRY